MITETLTKTEWLMCVNLATVKCLQKNNDHMYSKKWFTDNLNGVLGEYVYSKVYNLFYDWTSNTQSGSCDFVDRHGTRIDVKATDNQKGHLIVPANKLNADKYVLAIVNGLEVHLVGECWVKDLSYLDIYNAKQEKLFGSYRCHLIDVNK